MNILVLNSGSSSLKYEVFDDELRSMASGLLERIGERDSRLTHVQEGMETIAERAVPNHREALEWVVSVGLVPASRLASVGIASPVVPSIGHTLQKALPAVTIH